ncbi:MAG: Ig-like domain-containing protein [Syntrophales bacterium]
MEKRGLLNSFIGVLILIISVFLISCGAGEGTGTDGDGTVTFTAGSISLATSQVSVKSDSSDSATITASVLDTNNVVIEGATVTFTASGGQISKASLDTDEDGKAQVEFRSGTVDKSNRVATVTAQVTGLDPVQIPIEIKGTTLSLSSDNTSLIIGVSSANLTILVKDGGSTPIYNAPVIISAAPVGLVSLSQGTGNTDVTGNLTVSVTGTGIGVATVTVKSLGYTATQEYIVGAAGTVFGIVQPSEDPYATSTNQPLTIKVAAPGQTSVMFATTFGAWDGGSNNIVTKTVSNGSAEATLMSSTAGTATAQVSIPGNSSLTDSLRVAFSSPSADVTQISLQASTSVIGPSIGTTTYSATLQVTARDVNDVAVYGVPVAFSIENPTGGGEFVYPVVTFTDMTGIATSTFTSGSLSSDAEGLTITVKALEKPSLTDSVKIVIGGTAGSVVIGFSTEIKSNDTNTYYLLPMSVLVADANGNPVSGATVSLSVWPTYYHTGYIDSLLGQVITGTYPNEDVNRNLILDPGEEGTSNAYNQDGELTPKNSAAGTLPGTITTDENGVGNFDLVYLKNSATWITDEIKATTVVWGTETISSYKFQLYHAIADEPSLPPSPYGP